MAEGAGIFSMTGFASGAGRDDGAAWTWEVRSVNGRGLDIRCRMPPGMERIEPAVRTAVAAHMERGSVTVGLRIAREPGAGAMRVDRAWLDALVALAAEYRDAEGLAPPTLDGMLALRGVIEPVDEAPDDAHLARRDAAMLQDLETALAELARVRRSEGEATHRLLAAHIDEVAALAVRAEDAAAARLPPLARRIREQAAVLAGAGTGLTEDRLATELALLAVRQDVAEEIDRLKVHCEAAARLLREGGAVGRKLSFLAQELNREANTLCSKSSDTALTEIGLAMKTAIDRFREQVQNVE